MTNEGKITPREYGDYKNPNYVYGEMHAPDVAGLLDQSPYAMYTMLDAGSGCGRLVLELAQSRPHMTYLCGVELDTYRHSKAQQLWNESDYDIQQKVEFIHGDFLEQSFAPFDFVYCCNTMFDAELNKKMINKILKECDHVFVLYTLEPRCLPYFWKTWKVRTSWMKEVNVYMYCK